MIGLSYKMGVMYMRQLRSPFREKLPIFITMFTLAILYKEDGLLWGDWSLLATFLLALEILLW